MIKVKNSQLNEVVTTSLKDLLDTDLKISISWKIAKLCKKVDDLIVIKKDLLEKIVLKHSLKDEEGNPVPGEDESGEVIPNSTKINNPNGYNKDLEDLDSIENDIEFDKISIESIISEKDINIKPSVLFNLEFMFID